MALVTHLIIPSYNCSEALFRCLDSVKKQRSSYPLEVTIIDDASTEPRHKVVIHEFADNRGWRVIENTKNMKCPYTIKQGIEASGARSEDIIFLLDGDDFLVSTAVNHIAEVYTKYPQVWLTYGSYQAFPDWTGSEPPVTEYPTLKRWNREFRTEDMRYNHPLTFRRFLWDALDDSDLQDDDGNWFTDGYDQVIMAPMLEMAAPDHYAYLDQILYYYNVENPISDIHSIANKTLEQRAPQIRTRPKKDQLHRA